MNELRWQREYGGGGLHKDDAALAGRKSPPPPLKQRELFMELRAGKEIKPRGGKVHLT